MCWEIRVNVDGIRIIDITDEAFIDKLKTEFLAVSSDLSEKALGRRFRDPLNTGAAMVRLDMQIVWQRELQEQQARSYYARRSL